MKSDGYYITDIESVCLSFASYGKQTKALLSKSDKMDKSPPMKMTGQTKAFP
jgi:hypothetical protein